MDDRALIQQQLAASRGILRHCVGDISDDEARRMSNPTLAPIIWQLGHLAVTFDATHDALLGAVAEADLAVANEGRLDVWNNVGELFAFSVAHRWYHIGKINSLRALLGKPRLFG
jgi:hypothetical protein